MKKVLAAALLMATLSICAHADDGIIQTGLNAAPPPPPPSASAPHESQDAMGTADGIIHTGLKITATVLGNLLAL